jgi:FkbM family methyltransferase
VTYRLERGLLWPATDRGAAAVAFTDPAALEIVYPHCRAFDVVVQAGGCCGVWPADLGRKFKTVYTFEPDPVNFRCLCANAPAENIYKFNAALGEHRGLVGMERRPENIGAHRIDGAGTIPTLRIDDLGLATCDLIYLDIEGYELQALTGSQATILHCHPVIVIEDKGLSEKYGIRQGEAEAVLRDLFDYRVVERYRRDIVFAP